MPELAEKDQMGVDYWPLSDEAWGFDDSLPHIEWISNPAHFDSLWFDPKDESCLANVCGIDGLGPCLKSKLNPDLYILKDRAERYWYYDQEMNDLLTWPRDWDEEDITTCIFGHNFEFNNMIHWQDFKKMLAEEEQGSTNAQAIEKHTSAQDDHVATPEISAIKITDELTPQRPKSPRKRPESPVKAESPSKRHRECGGESVESFVAGEVSSKSAQRSHPCADDIDTTESKFTLDMTAALQDVSGHEEDLDKKSQDQPSPPPE